MLKPQRRHSAKSFSEMYSHFYWVGWGNRASEQISCWIKINVKGIKWGCFDGDNFNKNSEIKDTLEPFGWAWVPCNFQRMRVWFADKEDLNWFLDSFFKIQHWRETAGSKNISWEVQHRCRPALQPDSQTFWRKVTGCLSGSHRSILLIHPPPANDLVSETISQFIIASLFLQDCRTCLVEF